MVKPNSPCLMHYLLEASRLCGMEEQLIKMIHRYWGGMIRRGVDTCREVFREEDDFFSPYGNSDPRNNSACHAWSGTPGYFLRTSPAGVPR